MASKLLCKVMRNSKPFCLLTVQYEGGRLFMTRYDFEAWEYNSRSGIVELSYNLDEVNTAKLVELLEVSSPKNVLSSFSRKFRKGNDYDACIANFKNFCKENNIEYHYNVWY